MPITDWVWIALLAAGLGYEIYTAIRVRSGTLTETTRRWFQVHKKIGRAIFLLLWLGFAGWFAVHIVT